MIFREIPGQTWHFFTSSSRFVVVAPKAHIEALPARGWRSSFRATWAKDGAPVVVCCCFWAPQRGYWWIHTMVETWWNLCATCQAARNLKLGRLEVLMSFDWFEVHGLCETCATWGSKWCQKTELNARHKCGKCHFSGSMGLWQGHVLSLRPTQSLHLNRWSGCSVAPPDRWRNWDGFEKSSQIHCFHKSMVGDRSPVGILLQIRPVNPIPQWEPRAHLAIANRGQMPPAPGLMSEFVPPGMDCNIEDAVLSKMIWEIAENTAYALFSGFGFNVFRLLEFRNLASIGIWFFRVWV